LANQSVNQLCIGWITEHALRGWTLLVILVNVGVDSNKLTCISLRTSTPSRIGSVLLGTVDPPTNVELESDFCLCISGSFVCQFLSPSVDKLICLFVCAQRLYLSAWILVAAVQTGEWGPYGSAR